MVTTYCKSASLKKVGSQYCPGCFHGTANKILAETVDKFHIREKMVLVSPVGCSQLSSMYLDIDQVGALHGRAAAVATGIKRCRPDLFVVTYQGDGDLASIGIAETIHCANRGENITVIFINNGVFGMTGGQMAPTTLVGQKATTAPEGRDPKTMGYPIRMAEMIATLETPAYVARFALHTPAHILKAKRGLEKAFHIQLANQGYSFIELLANCPTNWHIPPEKTPKWIEEKSIPYFPLGELRTPERRA